MRLFKHQILILLLCAFVILAGSFFMILGWNARGRDAAAANTKLQTDLTTCGEIIDLKCPGPWSARNGELYKGAVRISFNHEIADYLSRLTGDTVTVFLGESRVATTERGLDGAPLTGTKVSDQVAQTVLQNGQAYRGEEDKGGQLCRAGYVPLRTESGEVIGMLYLGIVQGDSQIVWRGSLTTLLKASLALIILFTLCSWIYLRKLRSGPLPDIASGPRQAAAGSVAEGINDSSVKEIEELRKAFNSMAEQIQGLREEINRATSSHSEKDQADSQSPFILQLMKDSAAIDHTDGKEAEAEVSLDSPWYGEGEGLPKGLSKITLNHIVQFLQATRRPLSAEEVAEGVKLTRVTVRHYLEFLEQRRVLKSELRYGTGGRPVKLFILL